MHTDAVLTTTALAALSCARGPRHTLQERYSVISNQMHHPLNEKERKASSITGISTDMARHCRDYGVQSPAWSGSALKNEG
jgi:hypothetical protein